MYLDAAAATPVSVRALRAFHEAEQTYGNPSSPHTEGRQALALLEQSRSRIATLAEVKPDAVIFTGNATEANALLIQGSVLALHEKGCAYEEMHVLYDSGAHSSLVEAVKVLSKHGVATEALAYKNGGIDLEALSGQLLPQTVLVAVSAVCGETGSITPVRDMRRVLMRKSSTALLHVDACQLPRVGAFELTRLGADTLTLDAQKIGGVRGIGALIAPRKVPLVPLVRGGGQERGLRGGTPSPSLASSFAEALEEAHQNREEFVLSSQKLREVLLTEVRTIPHTVVNEGKEQAPHIVNVSFLGRDTDYLVALLDEAGFMVSTRSSCEADAEGSRAVYTMTGSHERASSTLRVSWGPETAMHEIKAFSKALIRCVSFLDTAGIL